MFSYHVFAGLAGNNLCYSPGLELNNWEHLCPCSTPFDYKLPDISPDDCPAVPVLVLVHWMQVVPGTFIYILNTHQDTSHTVHQLARVVHNPGPSHFQALDSSDACYLSGTVDLCFIVGNWTPADLQYPAGFHANVDASGIEFSCDYWGMHILFWYTHSLKIICPGSSGYILL